MIALVLALFIGSCYGQNVDPGRYNQTAHNLFNAADLNHDGFITKIEMIRQFATYDLNGNGKVSRHEYTEYICNSAPELYVLSHYLYDMYDANGDHTLDTPDYDTFFPHMDTNGDGQVDYNEYIAYGKQTFDQYASAETHHQIHLHGHSNCH